MSIITDTFDPPEMNIFKTVKVFCSKIIFRLKYFFLSCHLGASILYRRQTGPPAQSKSARLILGRRLCFVNRWPCRLRFSGGRVKSWMVSLYRPCQDPIGQGHGEWNGNRERLYGMAMGLPGKGQNNQKYVKNIKLRGFWVEVGPN